jgi:hypothetical protein
MYFFRLNELHPGVRIEEEPDMQIGQKAPFFKGIAVDKDGEFKEVSLDDYKG